jgi:hypothetical protein
MGDELAAKGRDLYQKKRIQPKGKHCIADFGIF